MNKIGLLAGVGRLPVEFARAATGMGFPVIAVGVVSGVDAELAAAATEYQAIGAGELDKVIAFLQSRGISQVTMLGKVTKEHLFSGAVNLDGRMRKLLGGLADHKDDTIMLALVRELALEGIQVIDQTALLKMLMPPAGVYTARQPSEHERADMEFGLKMARAIGGLDIGQTVVVKNRAVLAVEAIEGTDACIRRGGQLGRGGVTIAKAAKPVQDDRFDVPAVGPDTILAMIENGASALVIEAGKTLLVDRAKVVSLADEHQITIVAM